MCAGFWAYLVSKWIPNRKAAFYSLHRFLGTATLLTAFAAIIAALAEVQTYDIWAHRSFKGFDTDYAYSLISVLLPIMTLLVLIQAIVIVYNLVHGQQAIPVNSSTPAVKGTTGAKAPV